LEAHYEREAAAAAAAALPSHAPGLAARQETGYMGPTLAVRRGRSWRACRSIRRRSRIGSWTRSWLRILLWEDSLSKLLSREDGTTIRISVERAKRLVEGRDQGANVLGRAGNGPGRLECRDTGTARRACLCGIGQSCSNGNADEKGRSVHLDRVL
jgi:hypothetical protein